jgi:hypothetical protein
MTSQFGALSTVSGPPNIALPFKRVSAARDVAPVRGGSQAHLMVCSDDEYYIVKFMNNPQSVTVLANELLAYKLARLLNLPIPNCAIVDVSPELVEASKGLVIELPRRKPPCQPGPSFGSQFIESPKVRSVHSSSGPYDFVPSDLRAVENLQDFLGILVFDKWVCNHDHRQMLFSPLNENGKFKAYMIDNGFCFGSFGDDWIFDDGPRRGLYRNNMNVYEKATSLRAFEPWLRTLEVEIDRSMISECTRDIPLEWFGANGGRVEALVDRLDMRRLKARTLLEETFRSNHAALPSWPSPDQNDTDEKSYARCA